MIINGQRQAMSLPGLQLDSPSEPIVAASVFHDLGNNTEWRFEVAFGTNIEVKVCLLCWSFPQNRADH